MQHLLLIRKIISSLCKSGHCLHIKLFILHVETSFVRGCGLSVLHCEAALITQIVSWSLTFAMSDELVDIAECSAA